MRRFVALAAVAAFGVAQAQEPPKPGPEHDILKKHEGTWTLTMKMAGAETKGTSSYKMEMGGLWLVSSMECELFGQKFTGRGLDSYDAGKKKYVSVWVDSMVTSPLNFEGDYDKATKKLTMTGTGPGMQGPATKYKSVTEFPDADTIVFTMYMGGDEKEPAFVVNYKRKK